MKQFGFPGLSHRSIGCQQQYISRSVNLKIDDIISFHKFRQDKCILLKMIAEYTTPLYPATDSPGRQFCKKKSLFLRRNTIIQIIPGYPMTFPVHPVDSVIGSNPQVLPLFNHLTDYIITNRIRITFTIPERGNISAIIHIQAIPSTNPYRMITIFYDTIDRIITQPVNIGNGMNLIAIQTTATEPKTTYCDD